MIENSLIQVLEVGPSDLAVMDQMLSLFGDAFDDRDTYDRARPAPGYMRQLLASEMFIALGAMVEGRLVGGLAAYALQKFEQERSEIYIYDLAVHQGFRRRGVATAMIRALERIGRARGAYVIFVQADHGDDPAIALYTKLGMREDVLHFDIPLH